MKAKRVIFTIILIVCIAVAAYAAYKLISTALEYRQGQEEYADLRQYTVQTTPEPASEAAEPQAEQEETAEPEEEPEAQDGVSILKEKPPISVNFEELEAINPDVVAWLYLGAEDISYPVVYSGDNEYYLHRTFEKTDNFAGALFVEEQNHSDFQDPHTIVYGHNMKDGSMFGRLKFLVDRGDYQQDDTFWILTKEHAYKYRIFSIQDTNAYSDVYTLFTGTGQIFLDYIASCAASSAIPFPMDEYDVNSRVVTLSTCASSVGDGRYVVQGILIGEAK